MPAMLSRLFILLINCISFELDNTKTLLCISFELDNTKTLLYKLFVRYLVVKSVCVNVA